MALKLQHQLKELGSKLESPPTNKDSLIKLLKQAATCLCELDQSPPKSMLESMRPFLDAIVKPELVNHQDREIKLFVATCICEITRITAPEAPYSDDILKDIFRLIVSTFSGLSDTSGPSFGRRVVILETLARYRSCVVMLDLECDDLVNEMFRTFFAVASDDHAEGVLTSMQTIMVVLLEESEEVQEDLLLVLLSVLGRNKNDFTMAARRLAMNVIEQCAGKLEPGIHQFLMSAMSGDRSWNNQIDYREVIYDIYRCAPQILSGIVPYLTGELLTDQLDIRLKAVKLVGDLFTLPGSAISETFHPLLSEFLKRLSDRIVEVRLSVLEYVKIYLLSDPSRAEAPQIISALCDRLMDYDENVRKQVVAVVCDVACHCLTSIPVETVKLVADRLRDKSLLVKSYTMERLAEIYRLYCFSHSDGSTKNDDFDWIPGKLLRCFYDKDFRSDTIDRILCVSLFPTEFSIKDKVGYWVRVFSGFDKVEVKALEKILEQKQRLQQEMLRYLSLRQMYQDSDGAELQKKVLFCFRVMSRCFTDPVKAEENFQILDQLKDVNIWKILTNLLDPNTSSSHAGSYRNDLLKILGEKHRLYEFLSTLSIKCAYLIFNKEHVKELLLEVETQKSSGSTQSTLSCMNILVTLARFSPLLLSGIEEDLVHLLKDDNEVIKEGVLHVLAKAGGTIREQLGVSSSSLDLILERICLEGSRRQAKYAVHALAAITKDDGLKSLSVLYKRLVDMLEERTHLPAVLQSLGCIAQTALPVFETRESEVDGFIKKNILECSNKAEDKPKECWEERSELCSLKIFGIKTLVKSYLPVKDAHLRLGIDGLIGILRNIVSFGEVSKDIESSPVDKAHLRLAAAKAVLRLSKHWDHKIPIDVFYLTLRMSEVSFPQAKRLFLNKVHQYVKDRLLDPKYACAFVFDIIGSQQADFEEDKHNLVDIVQMCQQGKSRQLSVQSDASSPVVYPEHILSYLVHALAHHPSCPNVDECKDVKAFELIYRQMHLFLSMLVHGDEDGKSDASVNQQKEDISQVISLFQSIKRSEDAVDPAKSKYSHAICDLGLSITKRFVQKQDDLLDLSMLASVPPMLYKPREKKEGDDTQVSEGKTWLADESVLTHFESLKLEANGTVHTEGVQDEALHNSEIDENDVPLGKMIKLLKAKGTKARKEVKSESSQAKTKNENDVDILSMVREINLGNLGISSKFESSNGHEYGRRDTKLDVKHKKKKRSGSELTDVPVPKRRRSSSALGAHRSNMKGKMSSTGKLPQAGVSSFDSIEMDEELPSSEDKISLQEDVVEPAESDLLVSRHKGKSFDDEEDQDLKIPSKLVETDDKKATHNVKKRKRRSIAGLAKCTSKKGSDHTMDLIGCRIKIWWPMDKKFYGGVVKSFDTQKNKHVVLYDDGDVEVLRLEKERWELVDNGRKQPIKRSKLSKSPPPNALSPEQEKKSSGGVQKNKQSTQISLSSKVRGKRTPRKNPKQGKKEVAKGKASTEFDEASGGSPGVSDPEPDLIAKLDDANSGESEEEQIETTEKSIKGGEESDEDEISVSKEKQVRDAQSSPSDTEESMQRNPDSGSKSIEDVADPTSDAQGSDEEESSRSEENEQDITSIEKNNREEKSDSQENEDDTENNSTDPNRSSDTGEEEISDDEPLSTWNLWKRRVGK